MVKNRRHLLPAIVRRSQPTVTKCRGEYKHGRSPSPTSGSNTSACILWQKSTLVQMFKGRAEISKTLLNVFGSDVRTFFYVFKKKKKKNRSLYCM